MNKQIYFLSGFPRTGTTLLSCILNQNPEIYVSSTSGLLDFLAGIGNLYHQVSERYDSVNPSQIKNLYKSIFNSWYEHIDSQIILDKWRGWINNINQLQQVTGSVPKIIYTYRPLEEVVTSFLYLIGNDPNNFVDKNMKSMGIEITNENRARYLWEQGVIGESYSMLENYLRQDSNANVLFLSYSELINNSKTCLNLIYNFLELDNFEHDFKNINGSTNENDNHWELKNLHTIRSTIRQEYKDPKKYLTDQAISFFRDKDKIFDFLS